MILCLHQMRKLRLKYTWHGPIAICGRVRAGIMGQFIFKNPCSKNTCYTSQLLPGQILFNYNLCSCLPLLLNCKSSEVREQAYLSFYSPGLAWYLLPSGHSENMWEELDSCLHELAKTGVEDNGPLLSEI